MHSFRALFDTGSQSNFITQTAVDRLNLKWSHTNASVSGLGETATSILGDVTCKIGTHNKTAFVLDLHVLPKICGDQPIASLNTSGWSHVKSLNLADPGFDIPGPIDLLFAADVFAESLLNQRIKGGPNQPTALNSIFGWLLLGKTRLASTTMLHSSLKTDAKLNSLVQRFWEIENLPKAVLMTPDEKLCEQKFMSDHTRDNNGRYIVRLPFKDLEPSFVGSRDIALRRFHSIERRLSKDPDLHKQYAEFMSDYIKSGHMSLVPTDEMEMGKYYIPHHCVLRPESKSTRLRVVFDASAKDYNGRSLNDTQLIGPKLQSNIFEILLRFREHNIVFMADVRQMYRQISIASEHRDYQRIFWKASPNESIKEYRLNTVTYGVASSPFLACRSLQQLAEDEGDSYPIAKQIISSDVYVDDVVTGCDSFESAQQAKTQVIALCNRGGFQLRKWVSNYSELLSDLRSEDCLTDPVSLDEADSTILKVLGLKWDPISDTFLFEIKSMNLTCTKRTILSELARIFDPLGFLSPVTIQAKSFIQKLWILGIEWDQPPPDDIVRLWNAYQTQLSQLSKLRIPRQFKCAKVKSYELHGFADSSEIAYGAVIYLRATDDKDQVQISIVCSKARVAPLKRISLPRLELCAAVLLSDLYTLVRDTYLSRISFDAVYFWSDSTVVLSWLRSASTRWTTFVANRVSHIQDITPIKCWQHVSSVDNPADICSRGQLPNELLNNSLWWAGPQWLSKKRDTWPSSLSTPSPHEGAIINTEARKSVTLFADKTQTNEEKEPLLLEDLINRCSSLQKLINILTYINRFINNSRKPCEANRNNFLNNAERHVALMQLVKYVQGQPLQPPMSDLPSFRVNQIKAFSVVGIDFGGPFRIKLGAHRGAKIDKAYLCLFICLATKAVHLEVVSTLSTDGFIASLRRFIGRRGRCNSIHLDRGTNFIGARNQLSSFMHQASSAEKIEFKFNPPSAPHFGGVWEIQIKAAKSHLHRVVGDQVLTFEELTTLFVQIEAVLNSRPLCPISSDPNDLSVLTPGHFLTLEPLTAVPDSDLSQINIKRLNRWQMLQAFHQNFWCRWKNEYLNSLTQRAKWTKDSKPLKIGSMVIIKDENRTPLHWSLGRVTNLISGADGIARIAILKTATNNHVQRPLVKLCPLPIED
ncbi:uncharacterized protein LOC128199875 [Bicyclus anynana]|uniref:Uncharacterized protein LOC128199875 n=1 Tax=Bicyclus anynana TaxID=110368 RepID=A0ABM3M6N4_BICAN|nr:uncharacterized protein LOC128199875 [Bicyclus anynana]